MEGKGRLLTVKQVVELTTMRQSNIYRLMRANPPRFPVAILVGERSVRWWESDIQGYLTSRPLATGTGPGTGPRATGKAAA